MKLRAGLVICALLAALPAFAEEPGKLINSVTLYSYAKITPVKGFTYPGILIPDVEPAGEPLIRNGLSLCKLHHAAFDRYFIGIRPDFTLEVREDLRHEKDGPTLQHAIQGLHDSRIILPRRVDYRPGVELLEQRYKRFRQAQSGVS